MRFSWRRLMASLLGVSLASCSGATMLPSQPAARLAEAAARSSFPATIRIIVPRHRHHRSHYISPATKGMTIVFAGPTALHETIGLTPTSPGCTPVTNGVACTVKVTLKACPSKANCYSGSVTTYDNVTCGKTCVIPTGAHTLSADQHIAFSIGAGKSNTIGLTLDGIPVTASIVPSVTSTLTGNSTTGYTISKCVTAPQSVTVAGFDADNNQIVGPGVPTSTLVSDDTAHFAVATPAPSASPNVYSLVPPATLAAGTLPKGNSVVHLTASVIPLAGSGGTTTEHATVNVTFDQTICGVVTEFTVPTPAPGASPPNPFDITTGSDGNLWFTDCNDQYVGKITTSGTIAQYPTLSGYVPNHITAGPDGNLWYTEANPPTNGTDKVGVMSTGGVDLHDYAGSSRTFTGIDGITTGFDGHLWYDEYNGNYIDTADSSDSNFNQYNTNLSSGALPGDMTLGPDHNVWFVENGKNQVANVTTGGTITEYSTGITGSLLQFITTGPDGNLWFTEGSGAVAKITPGGGVTEYSAGITAGAFPEGITSGGDGNVWFTENSLARIAKITTGGTVTEYSTGITASSAPAAITWGPDNNLWFTECAANKIGRMQ